MSLRRVALGTVCAQDRTSVRPGHGDDLPYLGLEGIESGTGQFVVGELSKTPEAPQANSFRFDERHVLYGKLRPYLNKVALIVDPGAPARAKAPGQGKPHEEVAQRRRTQHAGFVDRGERRIPHS
jgi:hypothetical protein